jgi:O-antigen/teichoic acid export membrane protein
VYAEDIIHPVTNLFLFFIFYSLSWELFGAVTASVASFGIAFLVALFYLKQIFPEAFVRQIHSTFMAKELLAFSLPASLAGVFSMFTLWTDRLIIGYFCSAGEVGIYQAASQSAILFAIILSAFSTVFSPMITDLYHRKQLRQLNEMFKISTKWGLYFSLPLFLVICFNPNDVMIAMFGREYIKGATPLVILAFAQMINVGTGAVGHLLTLTGHQKIWFVASITMLSVNVGLNWLLVPKLGLVGAAISTACAVGGLFSIGLLQVRSVLGLWPYDFRYLKGALATAIVAGILLLLGTMIVNSPTVNLLLVSGITAGMWVVMLVFLGLDREDWELISLIRRQTKEERHISYV